MKENKPLSKHEEMKEKHRANRHRRTLTSSCDELFVRLSWNEEWSNPGRAEESKAVLKEEPSKPVQIGTGEEDLSSEQTKRALQA